jgi:sec-independent protein translocase protein TatB
MFDITSSKLLLLGIVALIVIGPKDLPVLLRTIGKYVGIIKRQAAEFRAQFDEAVRESELAELKKDVENMGREAEASMREAERNVTSELDAVKADVEATADTALQDKPADPHAHDANGLPIAHSESGTTALNGAEPHRDEEKVASDTPADSSRIEQKTGA